MTPKQKRRAILKSLGIGSAWSTPVVSSVFLPAHASTSSAPVNEEFLSAGTDKFTVPAGVTQLKIAVNGAGGGADNKKVANNYDGGNGEQVIQTVTTIPGDTLNITVGGGGYDSYWGGGKIPDAGRGGTPGDGGDAVPVWGGGGGGGYSQVTGTGISIQAGGGGGASGHGESSGGDGGGTNGGAGGSNFEKGGNAGNGLGGKGSSTSPTNNAPPLKGEDGNVIISST